MSDYFYMTNPAKIRAFLLAIKDAGVPDSLTTGTLGAWGFKSSHDRPIVKAMKYLGFINEKSEPTDRWKQYRNNDLSGKVLADGIKEHYADLFKMYPDANNRDNEAIRNFFSSNTTFGSKTINFMVRTFFTLCELATFDANNNTIVDSVDDEINTKTQHENYTHNIVTPDYTVNINIQLALPADATKETFDTFFESMKRNLIN